MTIRIERMLYGGAGEGAGIVVPFTLPGELVVAEPLTIIEASRARVAPLCPHFGPCGGCQYQHAASGAQVEIKREILRGTLNDAGVTEMPEIEVHTGEPWHYRNRIRLRFAMHEERPRFGYNRRGSNDFLPITQCPIAAPLLLRAADALCDALAHPTAWQRQIQEAEFFTTPDEARLQLTLFVRSAKGLSLATLCAELHRALPELAGAGVIVTGPSGKQSQAGESWGASGLQYSAAGSTYWVPRGSFFQVNRFLVDTLIDLVTADRAGTLAWDLYAGVGLFTRALREGFAHVVSVEVAAPPGGSTIASTTAAFLQRAVLQRERPDLVVMDPPRAGLGPEVCGLLARIRAPRMVYVSCDPATLARDLSALVDSGYTIGAMHLVDLFPQTFHIETVVFLHR